MHDKKDILKHFIGKSTHQTKPPESENEDLDVQHNLVIFFFGYVRLNPVEDAQTDVESLLFEFRILCAIRVFMNHYMFRA